jgi:uncharacterized protein YkwD
MNCPNHLKVQTINPNWSLFSPTFALIFVITLTYVSLFFATKISLIEAASPIEIRVVELHNLERQKQGAVPLSISSQLEQAALRHNQVMAECAKQYGANACFSHQVSQLNEPALKDRIAQSGYNASAWAENIGWGYNSAEAVMNGWMNSSGHKANIMNTSYTQIGCSYLDSAGGNYQGIFWTCVFARPLSVSVSTPKPVVQPTPITTPQPTPAQKTVTQSSAMPTPKPSIRPRVITSSKPITSSTPQPTSATNENGEVESIEAENSTQNTEKRDYVSYYEVRVSQVLYSIDPWWCNYLNRGLYCN